MCSLGARKWEAVPDNSFTFRYPDGTTAVIDVTGAELNCDGVDRFTATMSKPVQSFSLFVWHLSGVHLSFLFRAGSTGRYA
jgi:hypothetical protein